MMRFATAVCTITALLLPTACFAFDNPRSHVDTGRSEVNRNLAAFRQNIAPLNLETPEPTCPVCENDGNEDADRLVQWTLTKAGRLLKRTATFSSLSRAVRTRLGRRRYNKAVSTDVIVPALNATGSHFAALANRALKVKDTVASPSIEADMLAVLAELSNVSGRVAYEVAGVARSGNKATVGLVTVSAISVLTFLDRISLATTSLLVDYIEALNGQNVSTSVDKYTALQAAMSANTTNEVFGAVSSFLSAKRDTSGMGTVLTTLTNDMVGLKDLVVRLSSSVNAALRAPLQPETTGVAVVESDDRRVHGDILVEISALLTGITLTAVNSMQNVVRDSFDSIGGVLVSTLGIAVQSVDAILSQSAATFNSIIALSQANNSKESSAAASGDIIYFLACLLGVPLEIGPLGLFDLCWIIVPAWTLIFVVTYPITLVASIITAIFGGGGGEIRSVGRRHARLRQQVTCLKEQHACENKALSAALPSI